MNTRIGVPEFLDTGFVFDALTAERAVELIGRYPVARSALLPLLHLVQSVEGCVSVAGVQFCAHALKLETAEVAAVASFYTMYKRKPCGEHLVSVCTNTLCAALGGDAIYRTLSEHLGVGQNGTAGEAGTTGSITFESAECLAACDHAPVVTVNYEFYDHQSPDSALDLVQALQRGEKPDPTRGAPLTDFRTASLEIAGIFENLTAEVEGPSATDQTLRGSVLAHDNNWQAPAMAESVELPPVPEKK
ncbi:NADH-quinone oxidoreductase subunit E [Nakamurella antarctica]|uniref:NADH-quinone oxidoreductase subunit E n=1 Tax=Nakamurella antarctica TaxID=1902245 RepID=A0A3G8ZNC0_9ACTN|nr:NAD(P)H-dependent oxidoreductase subunit E [Nakamurella antarctica]AZI58740.1 NADH-quinone oxidoreductase subunit E [Nakamurella antarctica]